MNNNKYNWELWVEIAHKFRFCHIDKQVYLSHIEPISCQKCLEDITLGMFQLVWNAIHPPKDGARAGRPEAYCMNCSDEAKKVARRTLILIDRSVHREVIKTKRSKSHWDLYDIRPVGTLRNVAGNETVLSMAEKQYGDEVTIDNTVHAGRHTLEGSQVGSKEYLEEPDDNKILNDNELDQFFTAQVEGHPHKILENNKKKEIEFNKKKGTRKK